MIELGALEDVAREHERWRAEHGHWEKDIQVWQRKNELALKILRDVESMIADFAEDLAQHARHVYVHDRAIAHYREIVQTAGDGVALPLADECLNLHVSGKSEHELNQKLHQVLYRRHKLLLDKISWLNDEVHRPFEA